MSRRPQSSPSASPSAASPYGRQPPLPSPSLSPSITSLLNPSPALAGGPAGAADFFSADAGTVDDYFSPPPPPPAAAAGEATTPGAGGAGFGNLLAPDPASGVQSGTQARPSKRPRSSAGPADDDEETGMPPPSFRRRDSTTPSGRPSSSHSNSSASHTSPVRTHATVPPGPAPALSNNGASSATASAQGTALEPSIFNVEPIDEFTREVADWLWGFCSTLPWENGTVEIEAKIGVMMDSRARGTQRYNLPIPIESIITDDTGFRFQSNMTINQHKSFNQLLNSRVEEAASPDYKQAVVRYEHTREVDCFHEISNPNGGPKRKIRVTRDQKNPDQILRVVEKTRIADMNIFSPKRLFDWRISVSVEVPEPSPPPTPILLTRSKDRISYSHQLFTVDLTQVSQPASASQPGKPTLHELEIEFKDARILLAEGRKEAEGKDNRYLEMVQCFLNNVRMLIRNASEP